MDTKLVLGLALQHLTISLLILWGINHHSLNLEQIWQEKLASERHRSSGLYSAGITNMCYLTFLHGHWGIRIQVLRLTCPSVLTMESALYPEVFCYWPPRHSFLSRVFRIHQAISVFQVKNSCLLTPLGLCELKLPSEDSCLCF